MYEHSCPNTGLKYGLALGPLILSKIAEEDGEIIPTAVMKRMEIEATERKIEIADLDDGWVVDNMNDEEYAKFRSNLRLQSIRALQKCLRTVDGKSIEDVEKYLEEDLHNLEDYESLVKIVQKQLLQYQTGLQEQGESRLSSAKQMGKAKKQPA